MDCTRFPGKEIAAKISFCSEKGKKNWETNFWTILFSFRLTVDLHSLARSQLMITRIRFQRFVFRG
jgi:hypothetical protein